MLAVSHKAIGIMVKPNTQITYLYRDASNHKYRGSVIVGGQLAENHLKPYLFDHEFFVATEVGLKHLLTDSWNEDDHLLHSFEEFEPTNLNEVICSADEFVARFKSASAEGWFHT
jgi:hypothetical protein